MTLRQTTFASLLFTFLLMKPFIQAQSVEEFSTLVDHQIDNLQISKAKETIDQALRNHPKSFDVLWRASRVYLLAGDAATKEAQEGIYSKALEFANEAIQSNPNLSIGYIRRAAANGKIALFKGVLDAADYVTSVKDDAQKAIELNNGGLQWQATAHYILGRTHLKLTETPKVLRKPIGLDWGNLDEALGNLKKAIEFRPNFIMFHLEYGKALIKKKNFAEAKSQLSLISRLSLLEVGDDERKKEATELFDKIKGE
ncbi:MAG: hypothetical protein SFU91_09650 [Chloroherpetonaceae bacterium]|nr:hypothetical protein [Chloroherpetonaceae bacterium]